MGDSAVSWEGVGFGSIGGGGGAGFSLGPETNTFGADTTPNRAAAESIRDVYAAGDSDWLAEYAGNLSFFIRLRWTGNEVLQRRNSGNTGWQDVTNVISGSDGTDGVDGVDAANAADFGRLIGSVDVVVAAGLTYYATGLQLPASAEDHPWLMFNCGRETVSGEPSTIWTFLRTEDLLGRPAAAAGDMAGTANGRQFFRTTRSTNYTVFLGHTSTGELLATTNSHDASLRPLTVRTVGPVAIQDVSADVLGTIIAGSNVTIDRSVDGQITISATGGGGGGTPTPTPTYTYYLGVRSDTAFAAADFTVSSEDEGQIVPNIPDGETSPYCLCPSCQPGRFQPRLRLCGRRAQYEQSNFWMDTGHGHRSAWRRGPQRDLFLCSSEP